MRRAAGRPLDSDAHYYISRRRASPVIYHCRAMMADDDGYIRGFLQVPAEIGRRRFRPSGARCLLSISHLSGLLPISDGAEHFSFIVEKRER